MIPTKEGFTTIEGTSLGSATLEHYFREKQVESYPNSKKYDGGMKEFNWTSTSIACTNGEEKFDLETNFNESLLREKENLFLLNAVTSIVCKEHFHMEIINKGDEESSFNCLQHSHIMDTRCEDMDHNGVTLDCGRVQEPSGTQLENGIYMGDGLQQGAK